MPDSDIAPLQEAYLHASAALERLEAGLGAAEAELRTARVREVAMAHDLTRLGIKPASPLAGSQAELQRVIEEETSSLASFDALRSEGEQLAVRYARRVEQAGRRELEKQLENDDRSLVALENEIESRDRTSVVAARLSVRLEEIESEIVGERLEKMGPLLRRVYSRMDPHPSFRDVLLVARTYYRKGRLTATVSDALEDVSSEAPHLVLSSAQVNVLALAIFLTLNLSVGLRLRAALLDDPLQSLDNVNLLGLSDLLRRTKGRVRCWYLPMMSAWAVSWPENSDPSVPTTGHS